MCASSNSARHSCHDGNPANASAPSNNAIVSWPDPDGAHLAAFGAAGVAASGRAGRARVSFHLWNDEEDVDLTEQLKDFAYRADREVEGTRWSFHRDIGSSRLVMLDSRAGRVLAMALVSHTHSTRIF